MEIVPDLGKLIVQLKTADLMRTVANHTNPLRLQPSYHTEINLDLNMLMTCGQCTSIITVVSLA